MNNKKQKLDTIQEILYTVLVILCVRLIICFVIDIKTIDCVANYVCKSYKNQQYNEYIYADGNVNEYVLDETSKLIEQGNVPKSLIYYFYKNGGMVYVTDDKLGKSGNVKTKNNHEVLGIFRFNEKQKYSIWVIDKLEDTIRAGTLEHEFGHYLDYLYGWSSKNEDFVKIFEEEKDNFQKYINNGEHYNTETEYFAECYSVYLTDGITLKKYCSKTYETMELLTEQLDIFYNTKK